MRKGKKAPTPLVGEITVPGDKSISHRAVLLSALADGSSTIEGANLGHDLRATISLAVALGATAEIDEEAETIAVHSPGLGRLAEPPGVVDAGNSGTTLRIGAGVCAGVGGLTVLSGDASLRRRPMLRIVSPLRQMGATIDGRAHGDLAPLAIRGGDLRGIDLETQVASAQVKSAVLLAGLAASGTTSVTEPAPSRDHTERMLEAAGVSLDRSALGVSLEGGSAPAPMTWEVPGDPSSAMFLLVAAAIVPDSELTISGLCLNPTRTGGFEALRAMGAAIRVEETGVRCGEPVGNVTMSHSSLRAVELGSSDIPGLIDEIPALAIAAALAEGTTTISGAEELRVKESDRVVSLVDGLNALGVAAEARSDGLVIPGSEGLGGGAIETRGDHRIAMAFAVAGLVASDRVKVSDWSAVDTSFPGFLDVLGRATSR